MTERAPTGEPRAQIFGPFAVAGSPRGLSFLGRPVALDPLSLDILCVLAERPGEVFDIAALLQPLPSGSVADEAALLARVGTINEVLGRLVPRECYVAHYLNEGLSLVLPEPGALPLAHRLPSRLSSIVGRADVIAQVMAHLARRRFVTIVGTGGIGKTTVALAVADKMAMSYQDGVHFVDLAPVLDPGLVAAAVASALGIPVRQENPLKGLAQWSIDTQALIVLDSCEHVVDMSASVVQALLTGGARVAVLAASREPLRATDEQVVELPAMALPAARSGISAARALTYPAIELFVERARAAQAGFELLDAEASLVTSLCRRLDGIPLAIEIAAARVPELGLRGLAAHLERHLLELSGRRRTAPSRHRTLAALLDWSYELLTLAQQLTLQRLSIFRGNFTLESALAVTVDDRLDNATAQQALRDLVAKSLVASMSSDRAACYRLLDTTRAYAAQKLSNSGDRTEVSRRHAEYLLKLLASADTCWDQMSRQHWLERFAPWIDDVRSALDWTLGPDGNPSIGLALTLASVALSRQMYLEAEITRRLERALEAAARQSQPTAQPLVDSAQADARTIGMPRWMLAWERRLMAALDYISLLEEPAVAARHRFAALTGLWGAAVVRADFHAAARWSRRICLSARQAADPIALLIAQRMQAQALHFMGYHRAAAQLSQHVIENAPAKMPLVYNPSPIQPRVSMRIVLARILWLLGFADQAAAAVDECLRQSHSDSAIAQCQALAMAALPLALWRGDRVHCAELADTLHATATRHGIDAWQNWAMRLRELLSMPAIEAAEPVRESAPLQDPDANLGDHFCTFDARFLGRSQLERVGSGKVGWCAPEVLRLRGEQLLRLAPPGDERDGEDFLLRSLAMARRQKALAWELRTCTSLAGLRLSQGRAQEALALIEPVHGRFTEGFATADWLAADGLLAMARARVRGPGPPQAE